jgi:hypothetical protein
MFDKTLSKLTYGDVKAAEQDVHAAVEIMFRFAVNEDGSKMDRPTFDAIIDNLEYPFGIVELWGPFHGLFLSRTTK